MPGLLLLGILAGCSGEVTSQPPDRQPLQATAPAIVTTSGAQGRTRVFVQRADPSARYSFDIVVPPRHGTALIDAEGVISLLPAGDFVGRDALTVRVTAGTPDTVAAEVVVPVLVEPRPAGPAGLRIYRNPYAGVRWASDVRLKVQLHDHDGVTPFRLRAYDQAGYDVLSLMDYSGVRSLPYALDSLLWPPSHVLSAAFLAGLVHIKFFIPNGEQVGYAHVTSPFLQTYLERWQDSLTQTPVRQPWHYASSQEAIDAITRFGGMAILAHPWFGPEVEGRLSGFDGMELYSAFARYRAEEGVDTFFTRVDRNGIMLDAWDRRLAKDQRIIGVAVNDHFGPGNPSVLLSPRTRDSGKVLVLSAAATPEALRSAMEAGAVLAVKDLGVPKDQYSVIDSIRVVDGAAAVFTTGSVSWLTGGRVIAEGPILPFVQIPAGSTYVRAEIGDPSGSVVYTQAFAVRPVGDSDGNGLVDAGDVAVCLRVRARTDLVAEHQAACDQ